MVDDYRKIVLEVASRWLSAQALFAHHGGSFERTVEDMLALGLTEGLSKCGFEKHGLVYARKLIKSTQYIEFQLSGHDDGMLFVNAVLSVDDLCVQEKKQIGVQTDRCFALNGQLSWRLEQLDSDSPKHWQLGIRTDLAKVSKEIMSRLMNTISALDKFDSAEGVLLHYSFGDHTVGLIERARFKHATGDYDGAREDFRLACKDAGPGFDPKYVLALYHLDKIEFEES